MSGQESARPAPQQVISHHHKGIIRSRDVYVTEEGFVEGEIHAESVKIAGRVHGLVRATEVLLSATATVVGGVLASRYGAQPRSKVTAMVLAEPGFELRADLARRLQAIAASPDALALLGPDPGERPAVQAAPEPEPVPQAIPPVRPPALVAERPAPRPAPRAEQPAYSRAARSGEAEEVPFALPGVGLRPGG